MNITTISGLTDAQIGKYLTEFNAAHGADGVSAELKVNEAGETLVIVTGKGGETRSIAIANDPELDPPEDVPGGEAAEALEKLAEKLTQFAEELKADTKKPSPSMNVFCDIFALIHLLMEVAQQQQKTASAIRQQGHAAVQANLQAQADSIRSQAQSAYELGLAGAIMSSVMTVASLAMTVAGGIMQGKASKAADMDSAESNLTDVKQQLADVKETSQSQKAQDQGQVQRDQMDAKTKEMLKELGYDVSTDEKAKASLAQFKEKFMPETSKAEPKADAAKQEYVEAQRKADAAESDLETAKNDAKTAEQAFSNRKKELENAKTEAEQDLKNFKDDPTNAGIEEKYDQLKGSIKPNTTVEELVEAGKNMEPPLSTDDATKVLDCAAKHAAVDRAAVDLNRLAETDEAVRYNEAKTKLTDAETKYLDLNKKASEAHAAWQVKATELQKAQEADKNALKGRIDAANADAEAAANQHVGDNAEAKPNPKSLKVAQKLMKQIEKAQDSETTTIILEGLKNKLDGAREKMTATANAMGLTKDGRIGKMLESMVNVSGQFSNSINAFINTVKERDAGLAEAKRKEIEIELDKGRALIEEADDLRQSAKKQIDDFIQILASIQQIQTQTNLQMIRG